MSKWSNHKARWSKCTLCDLCETRRRVVHLRGKIPCDILFIGEAPGINENTLGQPFIGPAGKLLDKMVEDALEGTSFRLAFVNLVGCIPLDSETGKKTKDPTPKQIKSCAPRLQEIVDMCKPEAVVFVGKLPAKHVPTLINKLPELQAVILHPASILRSNEMQKGMAIQQTIVRLRDLSEDLVPF